MNQKECPKCGTECRENTRGVFSFYWCPNCLWNGLDERLHQN
nr:hypothetical protein [uncultured bacterium]